MSTIAVVVTLVLLCIALIAVGAYLWLMVQRRQFALTMMLPKPNQRKLTKQELDAVEQYLCLNECLGQPALPHRSNLMIFYDKIALKTKSENVYIVTRAITRYGIASDEPNKWRYFLETIEIHLPPFWEQHIDLENRVELIKTHPLPLVISLNGHSLVDYICEHSKIVPPVIATPQQSASIRHEENRHIELINVRSETREEHALTRSNGVREALALSIVMLLMLIILIGPVVILPWILAIAAVLLCWISWRVLLEKLGKNRKEIHCLRGLPKRWGLFDESNQGDISNISLGAVDLVYPTHWQPYIGRDLGQKTDIEVYMNSQVVRQGRYLSLHDEVKNFPLQQWGKNLLLACSSLLLIIVFLIYVPLGLPLKLSIAWLQGVQSTQVNSVEALEKIPLRIGDTLKIQGTGMCYIPPLLEHAKVSDFAPFDCSSIYWNEATPLPIPESETIDAASALLNTVHSQLYPDEDAGQTVNPQLATAIEKSGMILLDDFSDIVLKTDTLCKTNDECIRLKNALINLGNSENWNALVKRAKSGSMKGMNVLLRPVSAQSLNELTNMATASFFAHETRKAAEALNSPPPGGFLIIDDEGRKLIEQPQPPVSLFAYNPLQQWGQLQNLSSMLLHTQFSAQGVITDIGIDANGTQHISLHSEPDISTQWRYLGISLLLLLVFSCFVTNALLLLKRVRKDKHRINDIQNYYNHCFNPSFTQSSRDFPPRNLD